MGTSTQMKEIIPACVPENFTRINFLLMVLLEFQISPAFVACFLVTTIGLFMAILFLQSGLDKVTDWKGNLGWLKGHFEKSPLGGMVPLLLGILTFTEVLAGLGALVGCGAYLFGAGVEVLAISLMLCQVNFIMLFFGQRMAKDYAGAAGIVPYFLVGIVGLFIAASL